MTSYAILVIPNAHRNAMNRVLNLLWQDSGDNLSVGLTSDQQSISHWLAGTTVTAQQANDLQTLGSNIPTPSGGWPFEGVTEEAATLAVASLYLNVNTGDEDLGVLAQQNLATVLAALSLEVYQEPL